MRQRLAVHLISDDGILVGRLPGRQALLEVGRLVIGRSIGAVQPDLDRPFRQADPVEQVLQASARPFGVAHGARAPLHPRHMRVGKAPAVPRTLVHRRDLDLLELCLQLVERESGRILAPGPPIESFHVDALISGASASGIPTDDSGRRRRCSA